MYRTMYTGGLIPRPGGGAERGEGLVYRTMYTGGLIPRPGGGAERGRGQRIVPCILGV